MKKSLVFVPPSVQTAAERILLSKAYEIYHYPVADGSSDINSSAFLESPTVSENGNTSTPPFQPGSKACLNYNRHPEPYVVLAVAYPPRSADATASSSAPTFPSSEVTASLKNVALSETAETAVTEAGNATATDADTDTASAAPVTKLTTAVPAAATSAAYAGTKYLYLVLPNDASKLKPSVDISKAKVVYEDHLINPPLYAVGRVLRFQIPISADGDTVSLPVEIRKVVNDLGLDTMGGEPESKEWKYKFLHGTEWVPESALVVLDEMTSAGVLE